MAILQTQKESSALGSGLTCQWLQILMPVNLLADFRPVRPPGTLVEEGT
jgi:hypothetical protein